MRVKVLGCHGGELPGCRTTCLLIDGHVAIDAGALTSTLHLEELLKVDNIFLTHSHFDHVKDVPLMADLIVGRRQEPVRIRGLADTTETLAAHIFNDKLWPDFTKLPTPEEPTMALVSFEPNETIQVRDLAITAVSVAHPVDSVGFIIEQGERSIVISGDTGPTQLFWDAVNRRNDSVALFIELSFPNRMQWLADLSGHFTPQTLAVELEKIHSDAPVYLYHLKPAFLDELRAEVAALGNPRLRILELDDEFEF